MRRKKENWAKDITEWYPRDGKRRRDRPFRRWEDDLRATAGPLWTRKTHDQEAWKNLGEAYAIARQSSEPGVSINHSDVKNKTFVYKKSDHSYGMQGILPAICRPVSINLTRWCFHE
ncbi:jg6348 [Pararge aegeria aegeria]|uniref:Jg6348 protein n=1 Tax=Pararge aegeria aegeria TaxID=348720 RepID=A0A8S4RSJ7_9NEOP|nr:jg6348 [Pararge aegeria aegeria]